jgi:hypothetical protein
MRDNLSRGQPTRGSGLVKGANDFYACNGALPRALHRAVMGDVPLPIAGMAKDISSAEKETSKRGEMASSITPVA